MTENDHIVRLLLRIFGDNPYHAVARSRGTDIAYTPVEASLTENILQEHIDGNVIAGAYQLQQTSNSVRWLGWDVDSIDLEKAKEIVLRITAYLEDIPHVIEYSGGKGYHVLIFLEEPMLAKHAKKVAEWVRATENLPSSGATHVETFPKQDSLSKSRPKGNLLKIPLGVHPKTGEFSKFIDPEANWEKGPILDPIVMLSRKTNYQNIMSIIQEEHPPDLQLVALLSEYWIEGKRHDLSLYLSGFLAHEGWGSDQSKELIRKIAEATHDNDLANRFQTIRSTFARHKEGKSVRGRQGLGEILPVTAMRKLTELVSLMRAPDTVNLLDDIRYTKGQPKLTLVRLASSTIWSILNDEGGKIFQVSEQGRVFWYNKETKLVLEEGTEMWSSTLNKKFGLNPQDNFSRVTTVELRLRMVREAPIIPLRNRTYWDIDKEKLFVNLGGPQVYILNGETIEQSWNGECGQMFLTSPNEDYFTPDFEVEDQDSWEHLVEDLSFTTSSEALASPEEQKELLKAWILGFFFQELLPTKPILSLLGVPGSGKTTAIRRILRILESPTTDVLNIQQDKPDAFRASISSHRLLVMDNLEKSGARWMVDMLNKLATGSNIELRKLYKTNQKYTIEPRCFVCVTAVNVPFSDETLFSRLLILEMQQLESPKPEHILQGAIHRHGAAIWANLLYKLNDVVSTLRIKKFVPPSTKSRLVDFTVFCDKIKDTNIIDGEKLSLGLLSMVDSQLRQLKQSSQAIGFIEEWISLRPDEASQWRSFTELYKILSEIAHARRITFQWKNSQGLARHLTTLRKRLELDFAAEFSEEFSPIAKRKVTKIRFASMYTQSEEPKK